MSEQHIECLVYNPDMFVDGCIIENEPTYPKDTDRATFKDGKVLISGVPLDLTSYSVGITMRGPDWPITDHDPGDEHDQARKPIIFPPDREAFLERAFQAEDGACSTGRQGAD